MACYCQIALGGSLRMITMAKPLTVRAEQRLSPNLPFDRTMSSSSGGPRTSARRRDLVVVVNPRGANGRTGQELKKLLPYLRHPLFHDVDIMEAYAIILLLADQIRESLTSGPSHAIDITREAIQEGADAVIAVGGDGTLHEVVNGFFWAGKPVRNHDSEDCCSTALGHIPLGTGSDFARTFGWKNDAQEAVECFAKGHFSARCLLLVPFLPWSYRGVRSPIDVGVVSGETEESHYFINVADIHLYKRFGNFCYVIGALQAFIGHSNRDIRIKINDGEWETFTQVTVLCIGNAKFFGGGMKISPNADPRSGNFGFVILQDFKWYDFILKLHRLYSGTHLLVKNVYSRRVQFIEVEDISGSGSIYVQSDGKRLGFLPRKFCILPSAMDMIC